MASWAVAARSAAEGFATKEPLELSLLWLCRYADLIILCLLPSCFKWRSMPSSVRSRQKQSAGRTPCLVFVTPKRSSRLASKRISKLQW